MNKIKANFLNAITLGGLLIKALLFLAEWKAKKTPNKWDDKIIEFLKKLL